MITVKTSLAAVMAVCALSFSSAGLAKPMPPMMHGQQMKVMMHVTPMPSLMGLAKNNADLLGLDDKQKAKMAEWVDKAGTIQGKKARQILEIEKQITEGALEGADVATLEELAQQTYALRKEILQTKMKCRNNLKKVLNDAQWGKLLSLAKAMYGIK